MNSKLFKLESHNQFYERNGYLIPDISFGEEANELNMVASRYLSTQGDKFHYSLLELDFEQNIALAREIRKTLGRFYDDFLDDVQVCTESLLVRPSGSNAMLLHQDWSFTREKQYQIATLWFPTQDVNEQNGCLFLVPQSHKWFSNIRSQHYPTSRIKVSEELHPFVKTISAKAGQPVFFHPALWHGSYSNVTSGNRTVISANILPQGAPFLYYTKASKIQADAYSIGHDSFLHSLREFVEGQLPNGEPLFSMDYIHPEITIENLESLALSHFAKTQL